MTLKPNNSPEWCLNGPKREPTQSMKDFGWQTSDGTVNGVADKPTLEHTNGWMHNVGEFIKYLLPLTSDPVGTISMSMLTEQQMNQENAGLWVLCDGRNCGGTEYASITGNNKVPDLRKKYMVGAGTNSDGTFFANLLEEKQSYTYSGTSDVTLNVGGSQLDLGGDTLAFPSATMTSNGSIDTHTFTINAPFIFERIFNGSGTPSVNEIDNDDGGTDNAAIWPNVVSVSNPGQGSLTTYNWNVQMDNHSHTWSFTPNPSTLNVDAIYQINDEDITNIDAINFSDNTFMYSMKTNIFIRIN